MPSLTPRGLHVPIITDDGSGSDPCPWDTSAGGYPTTDNQDTCGNMIYFSGFGLTKGRVAAPVPLPAAKRAVAVEAQAAAERRPGSKQAALEQAWGVAGGVKA